MYFEKWGFMLIFGISLAFPLVDWPLHPLPRHTPSMTSFVPGSEHPFSPPLYQLSLHVLDLGTPTRKRTVSARRNGSPSWTQTFPQLPWQSSRNPRGYQTKMEDSILLTMVLKKEDALYCDCYFGVDFGDDHWVHSHVPVVLPVFFGCMIVHRAYRDMQRCTIKYGE